MLGRFPELDEIGQRLSMAFRSGVIDQIDRQERDQRILFPTGYCAVGGAQRRKGPGQQVFVVWIGGGNHLLHCCHGLIPPAQPGEATGPPQGNRPLLGEAGIVVGCGDQGCVKLPEGLLVLLLLKSGFGAAGSGPHLQGRGPLGQLAIGGQRQLGLACPGQQIAQEFLHLGDMMAAGPLR